MQSTTDFHSIASKQQSIEYSSSIDSVANRSKSGSTVGLLGETYFSSSTRSNSVSQ